MSATKKFAGAIALIIVMTTMVFALYFLTSKMGGPPGGSGMSMTVGLPLLAIAGLIVMLAVLAAVSVAFVIFDLSDKTQALALPEGSIRAVIALSLIILFAILSFYLYGSMATSTVSTIPGLSEEAKDDALKALGDRLIAVSGVQQPYMIVYREPRDPNSSDFAKQLLVMIGTLVTSIASFYFGAKAAAPAPTETPKPEPVLIGVTPSPYKVPAPPVSQDFKITGKNLDSIQEVKFTHGNKQVPATSSVSDSNTLRANAKFDAADAGKWDIVATDASGKSFRLTGALEVT